MNIIKSNKTELEFKIKELNARLHRMKETLKTGTDVQVYDTSREIPDDVTIPALPFLHDMDFKPTSVLLDQLESIFGSLNKIKRAPDVAVKLKLFNTFQHECYIIRIQKHSDMNRVWVKDGGSELALLSNAGQVLKRIEMDNDIGDFCVLPTTCDIYFCSQGDKSVRNVTGDMSTVMFSTHNKPLSICISADGNIHVGMRQQIVKYTQEGKILCESTQVKQIPVVRYPSRMSPCPDTRNIAVLDRDSKQCGGDDKTHVSILSEDLQLLYRYYGRDIESFYPWDVCYSDIGDIYIANRSNNAIQQISGRGEFIQTVYTDSDKPTECICVQSNGDIWAVFSDRFVVSGGKLVKVLQKQ